jgi:carbonic anhydrase
MKNTAITQNKISQQEMTPDKALQLLKEGNQRFREQNFLKRDYSVQIQKTISGQYPFAAVVSCIDSRIPTEIIFDQGIGDIFNARVAGNFVNEDILGSLEFSCKLAGSKLIVVMGHTSCGAIKGACDNVRLGNLTQMLYKIKPAVEMVNTEADEDRSSKNLSFVNRVAEVNVDLTIENIKSRSVVLNEMMIHNEIDIVGAMYNVGTGSVNFL